MYPRRRRSYPTLRLLPAFSLPQASTPITIMIHPVQIDSFLHNVKVCKSALGASLLGTFVMEIWHLSMSVAEVGYWRHSGTQHKAIEATMWADILGTTIIVSVFGISLCHCICWGILMSVFEFISASYRSSTSHHS